MRRLARDRRAAAGVEFALLAPFLLLLLLGVLDVVHLARGHLRVQSTATQIGQVISQCKRVSAGDQAQLMALAQRLLGPYAASGKNWSVTVTAIGRDPQNNPFTWNMQQKTAGMTPVSLGSQMPPGLSLGANQAVFRTEVSADVETRLFSSKNSILSYWMGSRGPERASGSALHMTRSAGTADLTNQKSANAAEDCLQ